MIDKIRSSVRPILTLSGWGVLLYIEGEKENE